MKNAWNRGPECRFTVQLGTSSDGCLQAAEYRHNHWDETCDEVDKRGRSLRETCQILVEAVGAGGPCDAEEAARRAAQRIAGLERDVVRYRDALEGMAERVRSRINECHNDEPCCCCETTDVIADDIAAHCVLAHSTTIAFDDEVRR